jgi:thioredoxin reductase
MDMLGIHAVKAGATLVKVARDGFRIDTTTCSVLTRSLILATGTSPKRLSCPGIASLMGDRVFSEIVEMPLAMIRRKRIVVIGGGDAAFDYAMNLTERGAYVTIIARSEPECLPLLRARAEANKITVVIGVAVDRMQRTDGKVTVRCRDNSGARELLADYILVACGREPNMDVLSPSLRKRTGKMKRIPETGVPGLFIAGDVTRGKHRQTTIAVGDGVLAAMMVDEYLRGEEVSR